MRCHSYSQSTCVWWVTEIIVDCGRLLSVSSTFWINFRSKFSSFDWPQFHGNRPRLVRYIVSSTNSRTIWLSISLFMNSFSYSIKLFVFQSKSMNINGHRVHHSYSWFYKLNLTIHKSTENDSFLLNFFPEVPPTVTTASHQRHETVGYYTVLLLWWPRPWTHLSKGHIICECFNFSYTFYSIMLCVPSYNSWLRTSLITKSGDMSLSQKPCNSQLTSFPLDHDQKDKLTITPKLVETPRNNCNLKDSIICWSTALI